MFTVSTLLVDLNAASQFESSLRCHVGLCQHGVTDYPSYFTGTFSTEAVYLPCMLGMVFKVEGSSHRLEIFCRKEARRIVFKPPIALFQLGIEGLLLCCEIVVATHHYHYNALTILTFNSQLLSILPGQDGSHIFSWSQLIPSSIKLQQRQHRRQNGGLRAPLERTQ